MAMSITRMVILAIAVIALVNVWLSWSSVKTTMLEPSQLVSDLHGDPPPASSSDSDKPKTHVHPGEDKPKTQPGEDKPKTQPGEDKPKTQPGEDKPKTHYHPGEEPGAPHKRTLHAVTYASHGGSDDRFCRALESALRNRVPIEIMGWGLKWKGLWQKLVAAEEYARALPANDVVVFTDAYDVLFMESPEYMLEMFEKFEANLPADRKPILFAAECGCYPHVIEGKNGEVCTKKYPLSPTPYRFLNSGMWVGTAEEAAQFLRKIIDVMDGQWGKVNDQKLVGDMYIEGTNGISIDHHATMFQCMHETGDPPLPHCHPAKHMALDANGRWWNSLTRSHPGVIHFNGNGKRQHLRMESKMWYRKKENDTPAIRQALGDTYIAVTTQDSGKMKFRELCPGYF